MSKSSEVMNALLTNWDLLKANRPGEGDFSVYGYPLSYAAMDEVFARWENTLAIMDEKGYWTSSPEAAIADTPIANHISQLNHLVAQALSNGVSWMLSANFLDFTNTIQSQLFGLTRRQASINKEIAKLLADRGAQEFENVIVAADAAKKILELDKSASASAKKISDLAGEVAGTSTLLETTNTRIAELAAEALENATTAESKRAEVEKFLKVAIDKASQAGAREKELAKRASEVDAKLEETQILAETAYKSVEDALRKVRDQGLAKSFQDRSNNLQFERKLWTYGLAGSAIILILVAIIFAVELSPFTYESLLVHLLRKIGLAAPVIWLGWYSARQIGRISRVQEDYEYKAASALAFQSYKDEAKLGGDPEMEKKLLEHAITTFGENPVRLYEDHAKEPVTPIQAAIQQLPPDKIAAVLVAVGEQTVKSKLWPFSK